MRLKYQDIENEVDEILERTRASRYSAVIVGLIVGLLVVLYVLK